MASTRQGEIPGQDYTISGWDVSKLRQWLMTNIASVLPSSIRASNVQSETVSVGTRLELSTAALADLKKQLGL